MNRFQYNVAVAAAVLGVSLSGCSAIDAITTPSYDLTQEQRNQINESARLGFSGQQRFTWTYESPYGTSNLAYDSRRDKADVPPVEVGTPFDSTESLELLALEHGYGQREDGDEMGEINRFTPSVTDDGVTVTYYHKFVNVATSSYETTVLRNPDTSLFGNDNLVSVDEMLDFYSDPATELVSMERDEDDISWKCKFTLEFEGNTLRTDAADDCSRFVDDSSTDQLVADLLDRYLD